jgi:heat-inducible transcriptional repressor
MDDRKLEVLRAIVADYVSSQEPVGSKSLVERHDLGVSPATVRNDMAALEEEGYIMQPHTSAGRIPTDKGYRLFVDRLGSLKPLSAAEQRAIQTFLSGALDLDDVLLRTVRLLAQVTQQVAIVQYPTLSHSVVRHVEIVSMSPTRLLLILITSTGRIEQRALEIPEHDDETLAELRAHLNAAAVGNTSPQAAVRLSKLSETLPPSLDVIGQAAIATLLEMVSSEASSRMVVGGMPNLTRYGAEFETTVRPVLEALEEQVVLLKLLGEASGLVTRIHIRSCSLLRLSPAVTVARSTRSQLSAWSGLPGWTIPRRWRRSAPLLATSADSSPKDKHNSHEPRLLRDPRRAARCDT